MNLTPTMIAVGSLPLWGRDESGVFAEGTTFDFTHGNERTEQWHGFVATPGTRITGANVNGWIIDNGPLLLFPGFTMQVSVEVVAAGVKDPRPQLVRYYWTPTVDANSSDGGSR